MRALAPLLGRRVRLYLCPGLYSHRKGSSGSWEQLCQDKENDLEKKNMFANNATAVGGRVHDGALRVQHRSVLNAAAQHSRILWTGGQPDWPFAPPWAGWRHCLSQLSTSSARTVLLGW